MLAGGHSNNVIPMRKRIARARVGFRSSQLLACRFPLTPQAQPDGKGEQAQVEEEALVLDVQAVVAELVAMGEVLGAVDLGQAGEARADTARRATKPASLGCLSSNDPQMPQMPQMKL
jgi:hypothetical protein